MTVFLSSVERRFSVPAIYVQPSSAARVKAGRRPPAKPARSGLDAGEPGGSLTEAGLAPANAECGRTSL